MSLSVGIVVPNYRGGRFLRECLDSLLAQDHKPLSVLVMDGGSDDESVEILKSYGDRIRWVSEPDEGQSDAIGKGFAVLDCDLVGWLNSDDVMLPGAVTRVVEAAVTHPDAVLFHGDLDLIDIDGKHLGTSWGRDLTFDKMRAGQCRTLQPGSLYRAEAVRKAGGMVKEFHLLMDVDLWIRLLGVGRSQRIPAKLALFRVHAAAKSSRKAYRYYKETLMLGLRHERDRLPSALLRRGARINAYQLAHVLGLDRPKWAMALRQLRRVVGDIVGHPANQGRQARALARFGSWQAYKRVTKRSLHISPFPGGKFECHPDSASVASLIYMRGSPDMQEMSFMRAYLRPGDRVLDVGANEGMYTVLAGTLVGYTGSVLAFEPDRRAGDRLLENVRLSSLKNVRLRRVAVSDQAGELRFSQGLDTMNHVVESGGVRVPCVRLDDEDFSDVALGKIDVEGAEILSFRGAARRMSTGDPPVWILEINATCQRYGFESAHVEAELASFGYVLAAYNWRSGTLSRKPEAWRESMNVLAVHETRWDEVAGRLRG